MCFNLSNIDSLLLQDEIINCVKAGALGDHNYWYEPNQLCQKLVFLIYVEVIERKRRRINERDTYNRVFWNFEFMF